VTKIQEAISDLKGRVGSLEAQVKLLQIHLSVKEGANPIREKSKPY
jgi:hypothetical protein